MNKSNGEKADFLRIRGQKNAKEILDYLFGTEVNADESTDHLFRHVEPEIDTCLISGTGRDVR